MKNYGYFAFPKELKYADFEVVIFDHMHSSWTCRQYK
jgi:hypothetical protein